jgi:hypothetical protein
MAGRVRTRCCEQQKPPHGRAGRPSLLQCFTFHIFPSEPALNPTQDIVYINRYDWSHHTRSTLDAEFQQWAEPVIGPIPDNENPYYERSSCNVKRVAILLPLMSTTLA